MSYGQIGRVMAVTLATVLCCGSLGSTLALWREKTFQTLAMTVLVLVLWLAAGEAVAAGALGETVFGLPARTLAAGLSPWQAILEAARPWVRDQPALGLAGHAGQPVSALGRGLLAAVGRPGRGDGAGVEPVQGSRCGRTERGEGERRGGQGEGGRGKSQRQSESRSPRSTISPPLPLHPLHPFIPHPPPPAASGTIR